MTQKVEIDNRGLLSSRRGPRLPLAPPINLTPLLYPPPLGRNGPSVRPQTQLDRTSSLSPVADESHATTMRLSSYVRVSELPPSRLIASTAMGLSAGSVQRNGGRFQVLNGGTKQSKHAASTTPQVDQEKVTQVTEESESGSSAHS